MDVLKFATLWSAHQIKEVLPKDTVVLARLFFPPWTWHRLPRCDTPITEIRSQKLRNFWSQAIISTRELNWTFSIFLFQGILRFFSNCTICYWFTGLPIKLDWWRTTGFFMTRSLRSFPLACFRSCLYFENTQNTQIDGF